MLQEIAKSTGELPPALRDRPLISEAEHFYISSFYELNEYRGVGETFQPLTLTDVTSYMGIYNDFTVEDKTRFVRVIKKLDQAYVDKRNQSTN